MACHITQLVLPLKKKQIEVFDKKDSTQLQSGHILMNLKSSESPFLQRTNYQSFFWVTRLNKIGKKTLTSTQWEPSPITHHNINKTMISKPPSPDQFP